MVLIYFNLKINDYLYVLVDGYSLTDAIREYCKTPRSRHSSQHYWNLLSVSEDIVGETKRRNRSFATVP